MSDQKTIFTYRDLIVWQKSMKLVTAVYLLTDKFPEEERYGLVNQMRRAAVSIPSNIAEGRRRKTKKDFLNFLGTSYGSGAELETQIEIAKALPITNQLDYKAVDSLLNEIMRMLNVMLKNLRTSTAKAKAANAAKAAS